ncbi:transposable element Tcb1 transposase [Trichonephila clavipes]|nr:transposable element Tcb1 transposase [Trichonephila clavipes]
MASGHSLPQVNLSVQGGTQEGSHNMIERRVRRTDMVDLIHLSAPLHVRAAEWSVRKTTIPWSTFDAEPQTSPRQWCDETRMWAAEWNEVVFTDESRICLQYHDGRIRVLRQRGERMLNSCVMHLHTGPAPDIMVWGGIGYHSRTPLVRIAGTLNSQRYISEVLEPVVLPYLQGLGTAIFQQDNALDNADLDNA